MKKSRISHIIALFLTAVSLSFNVGCRQNLLNDSVLENLGGNSSAEEVLPENPDTPDIEPPKEDSPIPPTQTPPTEQSPEQKPEQLPEVDTPIEEEKPKEDFTQGKEVLVRTLVGLNVRSKPNTSSAILGVTDVGDCLPYLGREGAFYQTIYKNKKAYVSNNARYSALIYFKRANEGVESAISVGQNLLGFPYVYGAQRLHYGGKKPVINSKFVFGEFDCSSLVQYMFYKSQGISLQVTTRLQYADSVGKRISFSKIERGDVLYFTNASRKNKVGIERIGHVAVYLGVGYDKNGNAICDYILHTATDHAVIEPFSDLRKSYFEGGIRIV